MKSRLTDEISWCKEEAEHLHGRAAHLLQAAPVGGPVAQRSDDMEWLNATLTPYGAERLRNWVRDSPLDPVQKAERLCIRTAGHLGDTAPPVNSQFAGAWGTDAPEDWGGWAVAQRLRQLHSAGCR